MSTEALILLFNLLPIGGHMSISRFKVFICLMLMAIPLILLLISCACNDNSDAAYQLTVSIIDKNYEEINRLLKIDDDYLDLKLNENNYRPIHIAAEVGDTRSLEILVSHGADVNDSRNKDEYTPLHLAAKRNRVNAIRYLVQQGANIDDNDNEYEMTPLFYAVYAQYYPAASALLELGADPNKLVNRSSCLHQAAIRNDVKIVELLLDSGADVNLLNFFNETALHLACREGNLAIVKLLVEHEADLDIINKRGKRPVDIARGLPEIADYLKSIKQ
jgi:ankyrin repeat protein